MTLSGLLLRRASKVASSYYIGIPGSSGTFKLPPPPRGSSLSLKSLRDSSRDVYPPCIEVSCRMWVEVNEVSEFMKGLLPLYLIVILPIFIIITPAECAHEFSVYRMQQFDLHGNQYGSRNALVSLEARTVDATSFTRKCVVANWNEINEQLWSELHQQNAGSVLILIPQNVTGEKMTEFLAMEEFLLKDETPLAIYFAYDTPEIQDIYLSVRASTQGKAESSALTALLSAIYASGYQMQVTASNSKALTDPQIVSVMGKLPGYGIEDQLPTIAVVAHYDAFGVAPELSFGADSNGSGVAMLIEILRLLSHLSSSSKEQPRANIMFLLAGGGKLNFQGSKRWLEDQLEGLEAGSLQDSDFTICLDTVGAGDELFMHVSKPPKEGSPGHVFYEHLKSIAADLYPEMEISQVHKKINLNTDFLAWEHERFSIRRLPAFTLSHLDNARSPWRKTILDTLEGPVGLDMKKLARNTRVVAEALARYLFKTQGAEYVFVGDRKVEEESLQAWLNLLAKSPRSPQLVAGTTKAQPPLVSTLEDTVARYASEVRLITSKPDKRDPEFVLYDVTKSTMTAYSVKPALFDLFLSMGIGAYLCGVYLVIKNFHMVYNAMEAISFSSSKAKTS